MQFQFRIDCIKQKDSHMAFFSQSFLCKHLYGPRDLAEKEQLVEQALFMMEGKQKQCFQKEFSKFIDILPQDNNEQPLQTHLITNE